MPLASQLGPDSRFMALFIGESGSGKTCAECSFPGPVKVMDFDGRIRGVLGAPWLKDKLDQIEYTYYPPKVGRNQEVTYIKVNNDMEAMMIQCSMNQNRFKTLVSDSITAQCFALLCDAVPLTHAKNESGRAGGKKIGQLEMAGPEDYGFEATGTYNLMAFLRSLPIQNIIVSAHVIDKFGKADPNDRYSERVVIGEKLSIRDKIGENIQIYFDHVFRFSQRGNRFYVRFRGDLARTSFAQLPDGEVDITGKNFYETMMGYLKEENKK